MIFGTYRKGNEAMPRVIHISVARYNRDLPKQSEPLEFLVAIHEEGTGNHLAAKRHGGRRN